MPPSTMDFHRHKKTKVRKRRRRRRRRGRRRDLTSNHSPLLTFSLFFPKKYKKYVIDVYLSNTPPFFTLQTLAFFSPSPKTPPKKLIITKPSLSKKSSCPYMLSCSHLYRPPTLGFHLKCPFIIFWFMFTNHSLHIMLISFFLFMMVAHVSIPLWNLIGQQNVFLFTQIPFKSFLTYSNQILIISNFLT